MRWRVFKSERQGGGDHPATERQVPFAVFSVFSPKRKCWLLDSSSLHQSGQIGMRSERNSHFLNTEFHPRESYFIDVFYIKQLSWSRSCQSETCFHVPTKMDRPTTWKEVQEYNKPCMKWYPQQCQHWFRRFDETSQNLAEIRNETTFPHVKPLTLNYVIRKVVRYILN